MSIHHARGRCAVAAALLALSVPAFADLPPALHEHAAGTIRYVTGGVGQRESMALIGERSNYPLAVEVYARDGGHDVYTAGSDVVVYDSHGRRVLQATADGPFLFADIPSGRYLVEVTHADRTKQRHVMVNDGRTTRALFVFDEA